MGSTYLSLHYHLVFATKERRPFIRPEWRNRLHDYLGGTVRGLGAFSRMVGGVEDHVHLLIDLCATHCLADFMRELKKGSSAWVHETISDGEFGWQEGYAAFSVSAPALPGVTRYIENQEEHHRQKSSAEELEELLKLAGVEYNSKYFS